MSYREAASFALHFAGFAAFWTASHYTAAWALSAAPETDTILDEGDLDPNRGAALAAIHYVSRQLCYHTAHYGWGCQCCHPLQNRILKEGSRTQKCYQLSKKHDLLWIAVYLTTLVPATYITQAAYHTKFTPLATSLLFAGGAAVAASLYGTRLLYVKCNRNEELAKPACSPSDGANQRQQDNVYDPLAQPSRNRGRSDRSLTNAKFPGDGKANGQAVHLESVRSSEDGIGSHTNGADNSRSPAPHIVVDEVSPPPDSGADPALVTPAHGNGIDPVFYPNRTTPWQQTPQPTPTPTPGAAAGNNFHYHPIPEERT